MKLLTRHNPSCRWCGGPVYLTPEGARICKTCDRPPLYATRPREEPDR